MNNGNLYAPFPNCRAHEGNSNGRIVRHCLARLAIKLVVVQFCRTKDHEIINEGAECVRSEGDAVSVPPPASYEPAVA